MRSHKEEKLETLMSEVRRSVEEVFANYPHKIDNLPSFKLDFHRVFKAFNISEEDPLVQLVKQAGEKVGLNISLRKKEGGSDANVFNEKGIKTLIIGTGMQKVHTTEEFIKTSDLIKSAKLVLEVVKLAGKNPFSRA